MLKEILCFATAVSRTWQPRPGDGIRYFGEDEWVFHMVAHMRGARHPEDDLETHGSLGLIDPVGNSIREIALAKGYQPLNETEAKSYESFLMSCFGGDLLTVQTTMPEIQALRRPFLDPVQPVATIAAKKGHSDLLKFALSNGADMNRNLMRAVRHGINTEKGKQDSYLLQLQAETEEEYNSPYPGWTPNFIPGPWADEINW